jgi:hypothetical protein
MAAIVHLNILDTVVSSLYAIFGTPVFCKPTHQLKENFNYGLGLIQYVTIIIIFLISQNMKIGSRL